LRSDTDAQLLLNIHFQQAVKIHSIKVDAPEDGNYYNQLKIILK